MGELITKFEEVGQHEALSTNRRKTVSMDLVGGKLHQRNLTGLRSIV